MRKYDGGRKYSPARLKLLIALIRSKCGPMNNEKLCWILYHLDGEAYAKLGRSLTGCTYVKGKKHPIPCHKGGRTMIPSHSATQTPSPTAAPSGAAPARRVGVK
jgi:hypothetical protein